MEGISYRIGPADWLQWEESVERKGEKHMELSQRIEQLALELTRVRSVTESSGEVDAADFIYDTLSRSSYYTKHPDQLRKVPVRNDPWGRYSVLALVRGEKEKSADTVVTVGHFDTVDTADYGALEEFAIEPYELTKRLKEVVLPAEARQDLESGDYLFGRGLNDMKAGVAILLAILEQVAQDPSSFKGNLVLAAVCDEEVNSRGMLAVVPELIRLRREEGLDYLALLNTDYITSQYPGDETKYIYLGTVGKIMPSFYIVGKETHVGEPYKGLDASQIAAEIVRLVNLNPRYCDAADGQAATPPITLKMRDLKEGYSVQTARTAAVYFNYATHSSTPDQVFSNMCEAAEEAFANVMDTLNGHYKVYCGLSCQPFEPLPFRPRVMSYQELLDQVMVQDPSFAELLADKVNELALDWAMDDRDKSLKILEFVHDRWIDRDPVIIVYFAPPYYPHIDVSGKEEKGRRLIDAVEAVVQSSDIGYPLMTKRFFPYISDLSYGGAPKEPEAVAALEKNMPGFGVTYSLPLADLQELDLPVVDIGAFGKDAHKFTERLHTKLSFEIIPELVAKTIRKLLDQEDGAN